MIIIMGPPYAEAQAPEVASPNFHALEDKFYLSYHPIVCYDQILLLLFLSTQT